MASVVPKEVKKEIVDRWLAAIEPVHKVALLVGYTFVNGHDHYADVQAWEHAAGSGYTAGGNTLVGRNTVADGTNYELDATDLDWTAPTTITGANFACEYETAGGKIRALCDLSGSFSVVAGTFTLQWHANGIIKVA
jgi:hypothetical protein